MFAGPQDLQGATGLDILLPRQAAPNQCNDLVGQAREICRRLLLNLAARVAKRPTQDLPTPALTIRLTISKRISRWLTCLGTCHSTTNPCERSGEIPPTCGKMDETTAYTRTGANSTKSAASTLRESAKGEEAQSRRTASCDRRRGTSQSRLHCRIWQSNPEEA